METSERSGLSRWTGGRTIAQSSSSERERSAKAQMTIKSALLILVSPAHIRDSGLDTSFLAPLPISSVLTLS